MIRRPPISTRTDTLFPYTTLFRSYELLGREGCVGAEPGLSAARGRFVGGLLLPGDETGDCHLFTRQLAGRLTAMGVELRYNLPIAGLAMDAGRVAGVRTDAGLIRGDIYLVALGSHSPALLRQAGLSLPVYPVKGYSITLPVADDACAPAATLLDESYKIAITRPADRIRTEKRRVGKEGVSTCKTRWSPDK